MRIIVKAPEFLSEKQMVQSSLLHREKYIFEHMKLKPLLAYVSAFCLIDKEAAKSLDLAIRCCARVSVQK